MERRTTFTENQIENLKRYYAKMVNTKKANLITAVCAETGLSVTTVKNWIGNYKKKQVGKTYPRKKVVFTKGRSSFNQYCSEQHEGQFKDWAEKWSKLSRDEKKEYKSKAVENTNKVNEGKFTDEREKNKAAKKSLKQLSEVMSNLNKFGIEAFCVGIQKNNLPFISGTTSGIAFLGKNDIENQFSVFLKSKRAESIQADKPENTENTVDKPESTEIAELETSHAEAGIKKRGKAKKRKQPSAGQLLQQLASGGLVLEEINEKDEDIGKELGVLEGPQTRESELAEQTVDPETSDSEPEPDQELERVVSSMRRTIIHLKPQKGKVFTTYQKTNSGTEGSQGGAKKGKPCRKRKLNEMSRGETGPVRKQRGRPRKMTPAAPVEDYTEENIFSVEKIIKTRMRRNKKEVLVKWQGYPASENTWEPLENINNKLIEDFESNKTSGKSH